MLNISENSINELVKIENFKAYSLLKRSRVKYITLILIGLLLLLIGISMFLPWTQNIDAKGFVTTRLPEQRPQAIQSIISGKVEKWYVKEGDFVEKGDTILFISEVKSDYLDPNLIERTGEQLEAKNQSVDSYSSKIEALKNQLAASREGVKLKTEQNRNKILQARNKLQTDSIELNAINLNLDIAKNQLERMQELHDKGLKSLSDLQSKELKVQELNAKQNAQENKLLIQKNTIINLGIEITSIENDFANKIAKIQSDIQSAVSQRLESVASSSKLQNQMSTYSERQLLYYITAPQSGFISQTITKGIGEMIKEGVDIATIMPSVYDLAIEILVKPQDLPLLSLNDEARLRFDGWPAIVISGWPEASTGIFNGKISAIDQIIDKNGYYRILLSPQEDQEKKWPKELRIGTGARTFILLNNVPLWYEIWRQLNGFPPDFYKKERTDKKEQEVKRKAPIKSIK